MGEAACWIERMPGSKDLYYMRVPGDDALKASISGGMDLEVVANWFAGRVGLSPEKRAEIKRKWKE